MTEPESRMDGAREAIVEAALRWHDPHFYGLRHEDVSERDVWEAVEAYHEARLEVEAEEAMG